MLLTDAASAALGIGAPSEGYLPQVEHYDDVGDVGVRVDRDMAGRVPPSPAPGQAGVWQRMTGMALRMRGMMGHGGRVFRHLP